MTKPTMWLCAQRRAWASTYPLSAQRRLWSDWADAQADPSLRWVHTHFVGFVMRRLICNCFYFWLYLLKGSPTLAYGHWGNGVLKSPMIWKCMDIHHSDRVKRIWYLSPMRAAKVHIRAVSPEPPLLAHTSSASRGTFRQRARFLAPLNGWACAVKICHDGMPKDTNLLDAVDMEMYGHSSFMSIILFIQWFFAHYYHYLKLFLWQLYTRFIHNFNNALILQLLQTSVLNGNQ